MGARSRRPLCRGHGRCVRAGAPRVFFPPCRTASEKESIEGCPEVSAIKKKGEGPVSKKTSTCGQKRRAAVQQCGIRQGSDSMAHRQTGCVYRAVYVHARIF